MTTDHSALAPPQAVVVRTGAERFWYVLFCLYFGGGYFAKTFHKKAMSEVPSFA